MSKQEESSGVGNTRSLNWWLRLIAAAVILFAVLIAIYSYMFIYGGWGMIASVFSPTPELDTSTTAATLPALGGEIFLSALLATDEGNVGFVPVIVLPDTHNFVYAPVDQLANGPIFSFQHTVSANLAKLTFLGWPIVEDLSHQTPAIYRADTGREGATSYNDIIEKIQSTATLVLEPDEEDYFRQGPVVSNTGDILYSSLGEAGFDSEPSVYGAVEAEGWTIYRLDSNNERSLITNGLAPKWIDETRFAFLKNDGIYLYDLATNEERLVWNLNFVPTLMNAFDVSDDGKFLAIANPEAEIVTIVESNGWEGDASLTVLSEVSAKVSGLTFAFDNSYLAMLQLVASDETGLEGFARLTYYSLKDRLFHDSYADLEDPRLQGLYLTDWK